MTRTWLALLLVAVLGGNALAAHVLLRCTCGKEGVSLPRDGATGVPTNARVWRLYRDTVPTGGPLTGLEPFHPYELPWHHVHFTTGNGPDTEPPGAPRVGAITIAVRKGEVASLFISGGYSSDTAILRLTLHGTRDVTYYLPADESLVCEPGFELATGTIAVEVTAIDLAGNDSPTVTVDAISTNVEENDTSCVPRTDVEPHGYNGWYGEPDNTRDLVVYFALILDMIALIGFAAMRAHASAKRELAQLELFPLGPVEQLARRTRLASTVTLVGLIVAIAGVAPLGRTVIIGLLFSSPIVLCIGVVAGAAWWSAHCALRLLVQDGAVAGARHDQIIITAGHARARLFARPSLLRRVQLPSATL